MCQNCSLDPQSTFPIVAIVLREFWGIYAAWGHVTYLMPKWDIVLNQYQMMKEPNTNLGS